MAAPVLAISGLRTLSGRGALSTMARTSHGRGRERRLRQRLFNAGKGLSPWLRERMMLRAFPLLEGPDKARAAL